MSMVTDDLSAVRVAKALADPTRYRLLKAIAAREEVSCADLTELFPVAQATVSHHLKVLAEAGLVSARKSGQFHYYRVHPEVVEAHAARLARAFGGRGDEGRRRAARRAAP